MHLLNLKTLKKESSHIKNTTIISYCLAKYPENFGGVPRYDYQLQLVFPHRIWFGPHQKKELLIFLQTLYNNKSPVIVITDNQYACDIPNEIPVIIVHHGSAATNAERNPDWDVQVKTTCLGGQNRMLDYRNPQNTSIVSISMFCTDRFKHYYGEKYMAYRRTLLWHTSELDVNHYKTSLNKNPVVLGNWSTANKGKLLIDSLRTRLPGFVFKNLETSFTHDISQHNREVEEIYQSADIFLQLSNSEGNSFATLDAFNQNLLICGSNVGLLYDLEKMNVTNVGTIFRWEDRDNIETVALAIENTWNNRNEYFGNSRKWFLENCEFKEWKSKFKSVVNDFAQVTLS